MLHGYKFRPDLYAGTFTITGITGNSYSRPHRDLRTNVYIRGYSIRSLFRYLPTGECCLFINLGGDDF